MIQRIAGDFVLREQLLGFGMTLDAGISSELTEVLQVNCVSCWISILNPSLFSTTGFPLRVDVIWNL